MEEKKSQAVNLFNSPVKDKKFKTTSFLIFLQQTFLVSINQRFSYLRYVNSVIISQLNYEQLKFRNQSIFVQIQTLNDGGKEKNPKQQFSSCSPKKKKKPKQ
eukprot:TRINITY_DN34913_c0_g1_i17.p11 TRINITY_DN34913_c0_g1~~TRINITY_DN34913_c0_g1_i17.p11  ORF type:complete len:102 (-),score=6.78 TRINITY_DN34913_c0_g1_i17:1747-2052(-)